MSKSIVHMHIFLQVAEDEDQVYIQVESLSPLGDFLTSQQKLNASFAAK